jgi:hypothetical protein
MQHVSACFIFYVSKYSSLKICVFLNLDHNIPIPYTHSQTTTPTA